MNICRFPKRNNLAVAARSKACGKPASVRCLTTIRQRGQLLTAELMACLGHASEIAVSKLIMSLPPTYLSEQEKGYLLQSGGLSELERETLLEAKYGEEFYFYRGELSDKQFRGATQN